MSVACIGVLCACAAYVPILGLRGAAFCLFPGLAHRSARLATAGLVLGFFADIGVVFLWAMTFGLWEPRWGGYHRLLAEYLPPAMCLGTHHYQGLPNSLLFGIGLVFWSGVMYVIWMALWRPTLESNRRMLVLVVGVVAVALCAIILWTVAPLTVMSGDRYQPFGDLSPKTFLVLFFTAMPAASLIVAILVHYASHCRPPSGREVDG